MQFTPGIYPIYKPKGPSSFKIIAQLRRLTGVKRIGHAGTLDPLASGVLVVAIGREFTKQLTELTLNDKEYIATIKLGENSTTDDAEGEKTISNFKFLISKQEIEDVLKQFVGNIEQVPPQFSAVKISGQPAYKKARKGQQLELKPRSVEIFSIDLLDYQYPVLKLKVHSSKGVYIRSLARDIGEKLGTGGYIAELERTRVGKFTIEEAIRLEDEKKNPNS